VERWHKRVFVATQRAFEKVHFLDLAAPCSYQFYVVAFLNAGTLRPHPHFLCYEHSGQGMVHDPQLSILRIIVRPGYCWISASKQSTNSAIVCERRNMFACCSIRLIAGASVGSPGALHIFSLRRSAQLDWIELHQPSNFIREEAMRTSIVPSFAPLLPMSVSAWAEDQTVTLGSRRVAMVRPAR
jgi:hypothetical protein